MTSLSGHQSVETPHRADPEGSIDLTGSIYTHTHCDTQKYIIQLDCRYGNSGDGGRERILASAI